MFLVSVQAEDFDAGAEAARLAQGKAEVGAVTSFVGYVRADAEKVGAGGTARGVAASNARRRVPGRGHAGPSPIEADAIETSALDPVATLTLEHYPGMTERALEAIVVEAQARWELLGVRVIHRYGPLPVGAQIVLVAVASRHRGEAFAACEFIMDYLKTRAPFWKRESTPDGPRWVDARDSDDAAAARWGAAAQG